MSPCVIALATMARVIVIKERENVREGKRKVKEDVEKVEKAEKDSSGVGGGKQKRKKKTAVKNSRTATKREAAFAVKNAKHFQNNNKKKHARFSNKK